MLITLIGTIRAIVASSVIRNALSVPALELIVVAVGSWGWLWWRNVRAVPLIGAVSALGNPIATGGIRNALSIGTGVFTIFAACKWNCELVEHTFMTS